MFIFKKVVLLFFYCLQTSTRHSGDYVRILKITLAQGQIFAVMCMVLFVSFIFLLLLMLKQVYRCIGCIGDCTLQVEDFLRNVEELLISPVPPVLNTGDTTVIFISSRNTPPCDDQLNKCLKRPQSSEKQCLIHAFRELILVRKIHGICQDRQTLRPTFHPDPSDTYVFI